jgi:hypothetical protein
MGFVKGILFEWVICLFVYSDLMSIPKVPSKLLSERVILFGESRNSCYTHPKAKIIQFLI